MHIVDQNGWPPKPARCRDDPAEQATPWNPAGLETMVEMYLR
jgi:hypothetical protein